MQRSVDEFVLAHFYAVVQNPKYHEHDYRLFAE